MTRKITMCLVFSLLLAFSASAKNITLVKHAKRQKNLDTVIYTVKNNDTLWKIFMNLFDAKPEDLPYLYNRFRTLNPSIKDLDHIVAGQKLVIPKPNRTSRRKSYEIKPVDYDLYVIKEGQHLASILREIYGLPDRVIFDSYLKMVKELNPGIKDLDHLYPGQKIKIPRSMENTNPKAVSIPRHEKVPPKVENVAAKSPKKTRLNVDVDKLVRNTMMPAFKEMGWSGKEKGMYYMPMAGGTNISVDTSEIPVLELDTGRRIILDMKGKISPRVKKLIEQTFPNCKVLTRPGKDLEDIMDKVLRVSGYFSVNKDAAPLMVGEQEKVMFSGKWIVYKDFSRRNVFVINILGDKESKTPIAVQRYASRFGIELIDIGGKDLEPQVNKKGVIRNLNHSYKVLLDDLGVKYTSDKEITLLASKVVHVVYKAPVMVGNTIIADTSPSDTLLALIKKRQLRFVDSSQTPLKNVLASILKGVEGPPVKLVVSRHRTTIELLGMKYGKNIISEVPIDKDILEYITSSGMNVLLW